MFEIQYLFELDISDKKIKTMMQQLNLPYPYLEHAIKQTLTLTTPEIPSEEAQNELIENYKELIKKADLPDINIENVRYVGIASVKPIPDTKPEQKGDVT